MEIYSTVRQHYGSIIGAIRVVTDSSKRNYILLHGVNKHYLQFNLVLSALRFLYRHGDKDRQISFNCHSHFTYRVFEHLDSWAEQGWPRSKYTSSQLYHSCQRNHNIPLDKIPKNYAQLALPKLKAIHAGLKYFKDLRFTECDSESVEFTTLKVFTKKQVNSLEPSKQYLKLHPQASGKAKMLSCYVTPQMKNAFRLACQAKHVSQHEALTSMVMDYVKN